MPIPVPHRYFLEVTLDNGQHLQSHDYIGDCYTAAFATPEAAAYVGDIQELRRRPMVEVVSVIRSSTGEVVVELPSFATLARSKQARTHYQLPLA